MVWFTWRCFHDASLGDKDWLCNLMVALPGLSYDYFIVAKTPILPATTSLSFTIQRKQILAVYRGRSGSKQILKPKEMSVCPFRYANEFLFYGVGI